MQVVDIHAHVTPERYKAAIRRDGSWYGLGPEVGELDRQGFTKSISERIEEMRARGIDRQLITPTVGFYQYGNDLDTTTRVAQECNQEVAEIVDEHPDWFSGLGTVPMQDSAAAIAELTRCIRELNLKGVIIGDHVNGHSYDEPQFLPFFKAAEALGAIVFFHQSGGTVVSPRIKRYSLSNGIGNLTERTLTFATLVFGGVMDQCPRLKPLLAHGGGYTAFGIGRLDKVAGAFEGSYPNGPLTPPFPQPDGQYRLTRPPSTYLGQFYYDCCTFDGRALRFLIDTVGIDRVMAGSDSPAPMELLDLANWVKGLSELTADEKDAILRRNAAAFLSLDGA
jgi:aminocarboxymuconate-semialdehyde decarboxylase